MCVLIIGDVHNRARAACIVDLYSLAARLVFVFIMQLGHFWVELDEL